MGIFSSRHFPCEVTHGCLRWYCRLSRFGGNDDVSMVCQSIPALSTGGAEIWSLIWISSPKANGKYPIGGSGPGGWMRPVPGLVAAGATFDRVITAGGQTLGFCLSETQCHCRQTFPG